MRPDARVQSAIGILDTWHSDDAGLDRILLQWARGNRYAGSGDRAAIGDLVYGCVRQLRSSLWVAGHDTFDSGRAAMLGYLIQRGEDVDALFSGTRHAPDTLSEDEKGLLRDLSDAPRAVRLDYPEWLEDQVAGVSDASLDALRSRAALDLRVNALKADPAAARDALATEGIEVEPVPDAPMALRVTTAERRVARSAAYLDGLVEIQDAGSQRLAALARPAKGELVIDLCAGGGGKALAMAAACNNEARILAYDISKARLAPLPERADRAGARIECISEDDLAGLKGRADIVFIDAPCTGSGAWRRNPDAKWRLTRDHLSQLCSMQLDLLRQGAELCKPSGRLIYGTCSILKVENDSAISGFIDDNPDWQCREGLEVLPCDGTDGFFGAVLSRKLDTCEN